MKIKELILPIRYEHTTDQEYLEAIEIANRQNFLLFNIELSIFSGYCKFYEVNRSACSINMFFDEIDIIEAFYKTIQYSV
jgi:hypothetical protein